MKTILIQETNYEGHPKTEVRMETDAESLNDLIPFIEQFLHAAGYQIYPRSLQIADNDD